LKRLRVCYRTIDGEDHAAAPNAAAPVLEGFLA